MPTDLPRKKLCFHDVALRELESSCGTLKCQAIQDASGFQLKRWEDGYECPSIVYAFRAGVFRDMFKDIEAHLGQPLMELYDWSDVLAEYPHHYSEPIEARKVSA